MSTVAETERMPRSWWAFFLGISWKVFTFFMVAPICFIIVAEGARYIFPALAMKLHRLPLPFVSHLRHFEGVAKLDLANVFAILLPLAAWWLALINLWILLAPEDFYTRWRFHPDMFTRAARALGIVVLGCDSVMFYIGVSQQGGILGGSMLSFTAIIATVAYLGAVIFTALISLMIDKR